MKKPQIRSIIPHFVQDERRNSAEQNYTSLSDRIADLHTQVIESRLGRLDLTTEQKLTVIDQIISNLKSGEVHSANQ